MLQQTSNPQSGSFTVALPLPSSLLATNLSQRPVTPPSVSLPSSNSLHSLSPSFLPLPWPFFSPHPSSAPLFHLHLAPIATFLRHLDGV